MDPVYLTEAECQKLETELHRMKTVDRPKIIQSIAAAREHGDLKENAEYHAAKEKQVLIENKILRLEEMRARVRIIDSNVVSSSNVHIGNRVTLKNLDTEDTMTCMLAASAELNVYDNIDIISLESPVGKAIVGKATGEIVEIDIPTGKLRFEILEIK